VSKQKVGFDGLTDKERIAVTEWFAGSSMIAAVRKAYNYTSAKAAEREAYRMFHRPRVQKAMREMFKQLDKKARLSRKALLKSLGDSVGRDLHDLAAVCPGILKVPKEAHAYITGLDIQQYHDDPQDPSRVTREEIKVRIAPVTPDRDQAFKIKGMYAPTKNLNANVNTTPSEWEQFLDHVTKVLTEEERQDPIERQIEEEGG